MCSEQGYSCVSPSIHHKESQGNEGARETVLVCLSSDVYAVYVVLLSLINAVVLICPCFVLQKTKSVVSSSMSRVFVFKTRISALIDLSVWGIKIKIPEEMTR